VGVANEGLVRGMQTWLVTIDKPDDRGAQPTLHCGVENGAKLTK